MPATVKSFKESVFYKSIKGKERQIQFFFRDLFNSIRYGRYGKFNVPRSFERLCIDPNEVQHTHWFRRRSSGRVIGGDWDINAKPIDTIQKVKFC
ncbi:hypothetical protein [Leucothrix pacifica]|uniref:Uncharacterized protein n=1 Tax=Leucothrix pacifica TaxID=1247513 RepID=A0A317CPS8_9GAMM|nr:hypothetical protein [Leucothrix pacifica]PWR00569.1 hypothetical protein DKW60_00705 [Leucothrix pacifica]